jgi:hypothetical protein
MHSKNHSLMIVDLLTCRISPLIYLKGVLGHAMAPSNWHALSSAAELPLLLPLLLLLLPAAASSRWWHCHCCTMVSGSWKPCRQRSSQA